MMEGRDTFMQVSLPIPSSHLEGGFVSLLAHIFGLDKGVHYNGSLLWRTRIDGTIEEPPAVDHGTIYVSAIASQSSLSAIRASNGHILWRSRHTGYLYAPVIEHGIVYLSTQEDGISAVRANDGMLLWHRDATLHQAPILKHGILFVSGVIFKSGEQVNHPDALYALHAPDGKQLWYHQTTTMQGSMFTVENDIVYAYMDGTCVALQVNSGREIWHQTINATFALLPQVSGGVVYLAVTTIILPNPTTSRGNGPLQQMSAQGLLQGHVQANTEREARPLKLGRSSVYALGASDGKLLWHKAVNQSNEGFLNWLQVVQDTVYFGAGMSSQNTTNGIISALNRQNGAVLWQDAAPGLSSGALLSGNVLYVSINDSPRSLLYALQAHDGTPVWSIPVSGEIYDAPTLVETTLYLGASNEIMYAFRSSNGDEVWHYDASTNA
jgi:outer membrane protein assembly factor BamB